jgi:hypothetical protein
MLFTLQTCPSIYICAMFRQIKSGLSKFFTPNKIFVVVIFLVLAYALLAYSNNKQWSRTDLLTNAGVDTGNPGSAANLVNSSPQASVPTTGPSNDLYKPSPTVTNPSELLPSDPNNAWGQLNPANTGGGIQTPDLLQAGALVGLDTTGQSLRNANLQLRSDPVIPKSSVGPWSQSTIEPDLMRAPFEINSASR